MAAAAMLAVTVFDGLLFRAVIPRRYEIWSDSVRVVLGGPFALTVPFQNMVQARAVAARKAYFHWGLRLVTTSHGVVEIVRKKGLDVVISPADRGTLLTRLNEALDFPGSPSA